jgi:hypothetical protein
MTILLGLMALVSIWTTLDGGMGSASLVAATRSIHLALPRRDNDPRQLLDENICPALTLQVSGLYLFEGKISTYTVCNPCSNSAATCYSLFGEVCVDAACGEGEDDFRCTVDEASVEMCEEALIVSEWKVSGETATELSRTISHYYTTSTVSVRNVTERFTFDENREPGTCETHVDGTKCRGCGVCDQLPGETAWPRTTDCSNVAPTAVETCATDRTILNDLTILDPSVRRIPPDFEVPPETTEPPTRTEPSTSAPSSEIPGDKNPNPVETLPDQTKDGAFDFSMTTTVVVAGMCVMAAGIFVDGTF